MFDRKIWEPILEKLRAVLLIQPPSIERDVIFNTIQKLGYNLWHRSELPTWCYATDLDFLEWASCNGIEFRALIETKHADSIVTENKRKWQLEIYEKIAKQNNIPVYVCTFESRFEKFLLEQTYPIKTINELTEQEYRDFQIKLHQCHHDSREMAKA